MFQNFDKMILFEDVNTPIWAECETLVIIVFSHLIYQKNPDAQIPQKHSVNQPKVSILQFFFFQQSCQKPVCL